jgi:GntR family transcriptional regulator
MVVDADAPGASRPVDVARIVNLDVDPRSAVPPYEQIRARVTELISRGTLVPGDRLPTVRQLASDLGVAPGTAQRAYRELELNGVVQSRGRHGTVVSERQRSQLPRDRRQALRRAASQFIEFAQSIGAQPPEIDEALDAARRWP